MNYFRKATEPQSNQSGELKKKKKKSENIDGQSNL